LKELGTRSITVYLQTAIRELPENLCCQGAELNVSGTTLRLTLSSNQSTGDLLRNLGDIGLVIDDIETSRAGLEEIFLQMTKAGRGEP
jgi:hypothetical protein